MVCIQTKVPSLSKMTNFGLKNLDFELAVVYFLRVIFPLKPLLALKLDWDVVEILVLDCKIVVKNPESGHFFQLTAAWIFFLYQKINKLLPHPLFWFVGPYCPNLKFKRRSNTNFH